MPRSSARRCLPGARRLQPWIPLRAVAALVTAPTLYATGAAAAGTTSPVAAREGADAAGTYLVILRSEPLATYDGDLRGYARTAPLAGHRFDADRPAVHAYERRLLAEQAQVLSQLGSPPVLYHYTTALDGFAASLTGDQVAALRDHSDILTIERARIEHLAGTPPGRAVDRATAARTTPLIAAKQAGSGTVVGVVDSGIWPENPSFAAVPLDLGTMRSTYPGFTGSCETGERWSSSDCNAKVIAARYFLAGFGASHLSAAEFTSARDGSGHGSHVAAVAAGNPGVDVSVASQDFGHVSGVAPAAGIAIYKACWAAPDPSNDGCSTADTAKAIDQAVRDGVDVLNYSVSGHDDTLTDVIEVAFLNAASAGVFVAAAAGDDGPGAGTVSHSAPWVISVAASQGNRYRGTVVLGNGRRISGAMVANRPVHETRMVYAGDVPVASASRRAASHCLPGSLDARKVEDAIVVCDRGLTGRVTKSQTVSQAGGVGMVLVNVHLAGVDADLHAVPTVHVSADDGAIVRRYIERARHPVGTLRPDRTGRTAPTVADFSARGPATVSGGDILKPDVTAPGVSILAAVAPPSNFGHLWDLYSGTSMATPVVSGLAAAVAAGHPSWSPAMIKSALMTTARPIGGGTPLDQGAGEVAPAAAFDPGLVYDAGRADWLGYLRGSGGPAARAADHTVPVLDASDVNAASIAIGSLVGAQTVTRTVTNVGRAAETYTAHVDGLHGVAVSVSRPTLRLPPGRSASFDVTFSARRTARYDRFAHGSLTWRGSSGHRVTSPIVVRPQLVEAPVELAGAATTGSLDLRARSGVTGTIRAVSSGLVGVSPIGYVLRTGSFDPASPQRSPSTKAHRFRIQAGARFARFEVQTPGIGDDLDLYVYREGRLVGAATHESGDERITLVDPRPGAYTAYVHAASASGGVTLGSLTGWVIRGPARPAAGNEVVAPLTVQPRPVTVTGGRPFDLQVGWRQLDHTRRWLGVVTYDDSTRYTFVTVN